jgi:hypothetical protein
MQSAGRTAAQQSERACDATAEKEKLTENCLEKKVVSMKQRRGRRPR